MVMRCRGMDIADIERDVERTIMTMWPGESGSVVRIVYSIRDSRYSY